MADRDCIHGSLARSCDRCEMLARIAELEAALKPFAEARRTFESTSAERRIFVGHYVKREDWIEAARVLGGTDAERA